MLTMKNKLSAWCLLLVMALTSATMQAQSNHNLETAKQLDIFNSLYPTSTSITLTPSTPRRT